MLPPRELAFSDALRDAIDARGLSLDRVRSHLLSYGHDVSVATLSYWQTGRSVPVRRASVQALGALEVILQVPRGSLAALLPTQNGRRPTERERAQLYRTGSAEVDRITDEWGVSWSEGLARISQETCLTVAADRSVAECAIADTLVAQKDGVDRMVVAYHSDVPGVLLEVVPSHACSVGRVATVLRETLTVAELLFDQPLRAGEAYRVEHAVIYDTPGVMVRDWQRLYPEPIRDSSLEIRFDETAPPDVVESYQGEETAGDIPYAPLTPTPSTITLHAQDFGPGLMALRWGWHDDPPTLIQPLRALDQD